MNALAFGLDRPACFHVSADGIGQPLDRITGVLTTSSASATPAGWRALWDTHARLLAACGPEREACREA